MQFLVYGSDGPDFDFGPSDRHEAHQAYMDGWLPRMIARGPTLSPDGADHTGSVHVLDLPDLETARRFAAEEPYADAGWYADVQVRPLLPLVDGTMWDRPRPPAEQPASFVLASWSARPVDENLAARIAGHEPPWLFAGLLLTGPAGRSCGFAGSIDLAPAAVADALKELLGPAVTAEVHRWQRGGRGT